MRCQFKHDEQLCPRYAVEPIDVPLPNGDHVNVLFCHNHGACVKDILWAQRKREAGG